ncbi:dockerin type I domain-containing protein [Pseudobacteroides cellulosolvens]|uniref:dockerin type I domain-containing protein n=1 Tax=Pseudobacteroides cellulosolvens TaxID=35825 RepID=UPI003084110C
MDGVSDGKINMADVIEIAKGFNSILGETNHSTNYDLNQDKSINMSDIIIIARHFGAIASNHPGL